MYVDVFSARLVPLNLTSLKPFKILLTQNFLLFYLLEETEQRNGNSCPVDCEKVSYKSSLSAALYLPQKMLPVLKYSNLKEAKNMPNDTDGMVNFML